MNNAAYDAVCRSIWREETTALDEADALLKRADDATHRAFIDAILRVRSMSRVRLWLIYGFGFAVGTLFGFGMDDVPLAIVACFLWCALYCEHGIKPLMIARYQANARATRRAVERLRHTVEVTEAMQGVTR